MKIEFPSSSSLAFNLFIYIYIHIFILEKEFPSQNSFRHRMQLVREALTRDFSRSRSVLRLTVDGPPMNAIRSRRSSKNVAHSHANDTRRINERHRCRGSSRRSLIGRRGITRRNNARGVCQFRKNQLLEKRIR